MRKNILWPVIFVTILLFPTLVSASKVHSDIQKTKFLNKAYSIQIPFVENRGQVGSKDVIFYAKTFEGTLFVEKDGTLTYSLPFEGKGGIIIKEVFTDKKINVKGLKSSPIKINYFKGKDKSKWKTNIPSYESIFLGEIYKGIDLTLRAYGNNVEKLFTVLPEEKPEVIKIKLQGAKGSKVNEKGELEIATELGPVKFTKPIAYQEIDGKKVEVNVSYNLLNPELGTHYSALNLPQSVIQNPKSLSYGFKIGKYNKNYPLIIDPLLSSTFIGGSNLDSGHSIALDESGNVYVMGCTNSSDYPTTPGVYDESFNGGDEDVFISKLDSSLSSLLASTFLGGSGSDDGHFIALDGSGNVYVTGSGGSDYPTTLGAYDTNWNGGDEYYGGDVFVSKLDSTLSSLLASTFLGGFRNDWGYSLSLDGSGNVYVTGMTYSSDYPTTSGAYNESFSGSYDAFVSRLDSTLSTLLASTFIGGGDGHGIALDGSGNVYVTGVTWSSDYPTTSGSYDESYNGGVHDIFISKLDSALSTLLASTFIGGGDWDHLYSMALDGSGNVYVAGYTQSSDYPTTPGAYDESFNGGVYDAFVSRLDSTLSTLLASTFIGGSNNDSGYSITLDGSGNVYVTGIASSDYPTTPGAYDESFNGGIYDAFVSKLDGNLSADSDGDGIPDYEDNCWEIANPDQLDSNLNCPAMPYLDDPLCGDACEIAICHTKIYKGGVCDEATPIEDTVYNRPGRRGLVMTCCEWETFCICSDCDPETTTYEWSLTVLSGPAVESDFEIDPETGKTTSLKVINCPDSLVELELTVTDSFGNVDSVIVFVGKVALGLSRTSAHPHTETADIDLLLWNPENNVRALQVDVCEIDLGEDNIVCTECVVDEIRTPEYICSANELDNGCCRITLYSTEPDDLIQQGSGAVATIKFDVLGEFTSKDSVILWPFNIKVSDQFNEPLCACPKSGRIDFWICGDVYPQDCYECETCGDGVVNLFDILEEIDIVLGIQTATDCQVLHGDVPLGMPPYCGNPAGVNPPNCETDGIIDIFDALVVIDKAVSKMNCCDYCMYGYIY